MLHTVQQIVFVFTNITLPILPELSTFTTYGEQQLAVQLNLL
jgi:hypothetical protein